MFELYRKSQAVQYNWIRKHPVQWLTINVILTAVFIGFIEYKDRRDARRWQNENTQQEK